MMRKDWLNLPRYGEDYINGVNYFLDTAFSKGLFEGEDILCPCAICCNDIWGKRDMVFDHLISKGFVEGYKDWIYHGEEIKRMDHDQNTNDNVSSDDIDGLLFETFKDAVQEDKMHEGLNEDAKKFYKLVEKVNQELYPGCQNFSTLSFTIRLYLLKCLHGWSNTSFTSLLELLKEAIPDLNIPVSFNKTKSMISDLGLDSETNNAIDIIMNNEESNVEAFQAVFGKEHPGSMRCFGKGVTQKSLRQNEEIAALKKVHNEKVLLLNEKVHNVESSLNKLKNVLKTMLQQSNPAGIDIESLEDLLGSSPGDVYSAQKIVGVPHAHSSTSTHVPNLGERNLNIWEENEEVDDGS